MAAVLAAVATGITLRQGATLQAQALAYGESLAASMAAQNAAAVLADEWAVVDVAVQQVMQTAGLDRLLVVDNQGIVRAASTAAVVGQAYVRPSPLGGDAWWNLAPFAGERADGARAGAPLRYRTGTGVAMSFEVPVRFDGRTVGRVALGLPEAPLASAVRQSAAMMALLVLVTVLAVAVSVFAVARSSSRPLRLVHEALSELAQGRFGHRIAEHRRDEFGQLFLAVDQLALALQRRADGDTGTPAPLRLAQAPRAP